MLRNYFKSALRNLWKNKSFSIINVTGLTIGLTSCLVIGLYIQYELSYDDFQVNGNRIARVIMEYSFNGSAESKKGNFTSVRVAFIFKKNFPEVVSVIKMFKSERVVKYQDKLFSEKNFVFADPTFFDLLSFRLLQGNPQTVLQATCQVVLTESTGLPE